MKKLLFLTLVPFAPIVGVCPGLASAQQAPDLLRFEWITGLLAQGNMADVDFVLDVTSFGGQIVERNGGFLDVDPSLWFGIRTTYRIGEHLSLSGSWMHSEGRYRVQFPARASVEGNFDLEGLILAGEDFLAGNNDDERAESAMSMARTDVFLAAANWEFPLLDRRMFPHLSLGAGRFRQESDGDVIQIRYEKSVPARIQNAENLGFSATGLSGLSEFSIDETDWVVSFAGGVRVAIGEKWGVDVQLEDLVRIGVDLSEINDTSTPPPDPESFRVYSTTFVGEEGRIHNLGIRLSVNYAFWPYGTPR